MKLTDILKTVGSGLIQTMIPGAGSLIVAGLNAVLPPDKQLPATATGQDAHNAIQALSPEQRASVLNKEYDVEIEEIRGFTNVVTALGEVDKTGNTTRPQIAMMMAVCVVFAVIGAVGVYMYAVITKDNIMIDSITGGWPFIVGVLSVPSSVILHYFGKRTKEKCHKYEATTGVSAPLSLLQSFLTKK